MSTVNCQLSTVNCQLSTVNCQLSTVNCLLQVRRDELLGPDLLHRALHTLGHHTLGLGQQREILLPLLRQVQAVTAAPG